MSLAAIKARWLVDGMTHEGCRKRPDNGCDLLDLIAVAEAAQGAIAAIMVQPGEFTTDEVGLDDLLAALGGLK